MRYLVRFLCVCVFGMVSLVGCGEPLCEDGVCPCSEAGIRAAIQAGGDDPYTFRCDGPQRVVTEAEIVIDNDVILDGQGTLTVVPTLGSVRHRIFSVPEGVTAELHGFTVQSGYVYADDGGGIANHGTLTIRDCVISGNTAGDLEGGDNFDNFGSGGGIRNTGELAIIDSTISQNGSGWRDGGGISNAGEMTIINSTVSKNRASDGRGGGINNESSASLTITNSTISENGADLCSLCPAVGDDISNAGEMTIINSTVSGGGMAIENTGGTAMLTGSTVFTASEQSVAVYANGGSVIETALTLIHGRCARSFVDDAIWVSNGYNIESPGDTCGFDRSTDMPGMSGDDLKLEELADNGGPTKTHALGAGSEAIDKIPAEDCEVETDQRGEPRPAGTTDPKACDVGAFEVQ